MNDLSDVLKTIKSHYSKRKTIDFEEADLHVEVEPLTSLEEIKILEASKDVEGSQYIEALKRNSLACAIKKINDFDLNKSDLEYEDENGEKKEKSKFLFMTEYLSEWPSSIIDILFNAFTEMQTEVEDKIKKDAKFERFKMSEKPTEDQPEKFRKIKETDNVPGTTPVERLNKKVEQEINKADLKMAEKENQMKESLNG